MIRLWWEQAEGHTLKTRLMCRNITVIVLSASTLMTGQYGEEGIFTSLPCVIGAEGVEEVYTLDLSERELEGFHKSCQHIRDNIAQLDWWDEAAWNAK